VALCDQGIIVRSTDDGITWSVVVSRHAVLQGIAVTQKGTLVVAGGQDATHDSPQPAVILRSVDGGSHWSEVTGINSRDWLMSVTAESSGSLIAFGQSGEELRSTDDGLNWLPVDTGTKSIALFTTFEQDHTILAAGDEGTILRSVDGGASWSQQYRERNFTVVELLRGPLVSR
jgi:photosystem II stability/assembly factor-like uncharacterized protein